MVQLIQRTPEKNLSAIYVGIALPVKRGMSELTTPKMPAIHKRFTNPWGNFILRPFLGVL